MSSWTLIWVSGFISGTTLMLWTRTMSERDPDPWLQAMRRQVLKMGLLGIVVLTAGAIVVEMTNP